jgi:type I restriction enzyme R subunit
MKSICASELNQLGSSLNTSSGRSNKQQFADSPDLAKEIMNAIMDALAAHGTMSKQALGSERVRNGLKDVLLGPAQLYESLRGRGEEGRTL